jgi:hypothetical protein
MREKLAVFKDHRQLQSFLLVFLLVTTTMTVVFSLTAPEARGQVVHLGTASAEDATGLPYDIGPMGDGEVIWDPNEDHIISNMNGYAVEDFMTLDIPNDVSVTFQGMSLRIIDVYGTLITNYGSLMPPTFTTFDASGGWEGIIFHSGSQGRIVSTIIQGAAQGVVFKPGSTLLNPGVKYSIFEDCADYGLSMDGASGFTSISDTNFNDGSGQITTSLYVENGSLDMDNVAFISHNERDPGLHIVNASVNAYDCSFNGFDQPGNMVIIEGDSNNTVLNECTFLNGQAGEYYVRVDGSSPLITNSKLRTSGVAFSVIANDGLSGIPAHPVLLNPTGEGSPGDWSDTFDNSTINATGISSVTLKWYMDAYVKNPNSDPIENAVVWVNDSIGNPAEPPSMITDASGWARWFEVTELIKYNNSIANFNPFNVSAVASSMKGYVDPEPTMYMSRRFNITVPFNPNDVPPIVSWIATPSGVQSGLITIGYILEDPNPWDDGNMSIIVEYSTDGVTWFPAVSGPGSDLDNLNNNTLHQFVWDSADPLNLGNTFSATTYLRITPSDMMGNGTDSQTGSFTVDNKPPIVSWLPTPVGVQSGLISIDYKVVGFNVGDDGNMGVEVFFSTDNMTWLPATQGGGNPTTGLNNDTLYTYVWDSRNAKDLPGIYNTTVYIQIIPSNNGGNGTPKQTGNFIVDNLAPVLLSLPTTTSTNTTCLVEWTMDEPAYATVNYGLYVNGDPSDITDSASDPTFSASQAVTLTGLEPGRNYTYSFESTDGGGNTFTFPGVLYFDTEVHIQLYTGWNMISLPPTISPNDIATVFASIAGDYDIIRFYNALDPVDPWKNYIPGKPFGNDLEIVYPQMGFMIHMLNDAVLIHTTHTVPKPPTMNPTTSTPLDQGWNMVGYPSVTNRPVASVMAGITYDLIQTYNATSGQWESWDGSSGDLTMFEMGRGYWIHVPFGIQFLDVDYHD